MRNPRLPRGGMSILGVIVTVAVLAAGTAALAAGGATSSKAPKLTIKCPAKVMGGKKVTCRVFGSLPRGPRGATGATGPRGQRGQKGEKGQRGEKGAKGDAGARGSAGTNGVSGYEVVSQTFEGVDVVNSGGQRGLSEVKTVTCPGGKRVVSGGTDLGTNPAQNGQQRQVTVSLSGPNGSGTGWSAQLFNNSVSEDTAIDLRVFAICASAG